MSPGRPGLKPPVGENDHALGGGADAPVTVVEFADDQCPHCRQAHPVGAAVRERFGSRMRFVFRNFPLSEIHPQALHAAEAAEA